MWFVVCSCALVLCVPSDANGQTQPQAAGKTLDELEAYLKASRAELGARLSKEDQEARTPPTVQQGEISDGEKRFLEIEAIINERRLQRERELLEIPKTPERVPGAPPRVTPLRIDDPLEPLPSTLPSPSSDAVAMGEALLLSDVIASTYRAYPEIEMARLEARVTGGQTTTAYGAYDTHLDYYTLNKPVGYYENSRNGVSLSRQLWWGGYAMAGYRIGRGTFEPWYKELQTNKGGEFHAGWVQPLLQGRAIDPYRVELFQANLNQQAVKPEIQQNILSASFDASIAYWKWIEAGNVLLAQERLLELAVKRNDGLQKLLDRGLATRQELSINAQAISERQLKVYESRLKFRDTAFKLAIFLRDEAGSPMLANPDWLPSDFPRLIELPPQNFEEEFAGAQERRPELALLNIEIQKLRWDVQLAQNQMLPNVDFTVRGIQNVGSPATIIDDKGEFILESGLVGGVPIQRRKARGKIESTLAKIQQVEQKRWLQLNKIEIDLRAARNAVDISRDMVIRSEQLLRETQQTLEYFRRDFAAGNRDFIFLLGQEAKATEAEIKLLDSERDYFIALSSLQVTLGLDPLEQSLNLDTLAQQPESK